MANNKVVYGNETIMDISDSTVTPEKLKQGEVAYNAAGQRIEGTYSPPDVSTKYDSNDTTESDLADDDKMPFYDDSASTRRNSTWANIKAKLKAYFDTLYTTLSHNHSISFGVSSSSSMDLSSNTNYKISIKSPDNLSINEITFKTPPDPTVNNGKLTITQAGTTKGTFTANQSGNATIELTDTNTWRGIQNNLTSSSTTDSLSANQGRILKSYIDNIGAYTTATGTYKTASWAEGTNTATWKAPAAGTYMVWMRFYMNNETAAKRNAYKQFHMRGTATGVIGGCLWFDGTGGQSVVRTISQPVVATAANQTIIPYVHTDVANIEFGITIAAVRVK